MSNATHKMIQLVGTSDKSYEDALQAAIAKASQTVRGLEWYEVVEHRGRIQGGKITQYQIGLRVGFKLD